MMARSTKAPIKGRIHSCKTATALKLGKVFLQRTAGPYIRVKSGEDHQRGFAAHVRFSNRPTEVKRFQTIHLCGVDVARGLALLFGIGTTALVSTQITGKPASARALNSHCDSGPASNPTRLKR